MGLSQLQKAPHTPKTARANVILVLTMFNETAVSQAPWEEACAVMLGKLHADGQQVDLSGHFPKPHFPRLCYKMVISVTPASLNDE